MCKWRLEVIFVAKFAGLFSLLEQGRRFAAARRWILTTFQTKKIAGLFLNAEAKCSISWVLEGVGSRIHRPAGWILFCFFFPGEVPGWLPGSCLGLPVYYWIDIFEAL